MSPQHPMGWFLPCPFKDDAAVTAAIAYGTELRTTTQ